jgi:hypothetical protein
MILVDLRILPVPLCFVESLNTQCEMRPGIHFIVILLISATHLRGQGNFLPAYIIDPHQGKISGLIDDQGDVKNAGICLFRAGEQSDAVEYRPGSIPGYGFEDNRYYESKTIRLDGGEQVVFAECLVKGVASLYYLRNEKGDLYFIEIEGSGMVALTNEIREAPVYGTTTTYYSKSYIRTLKAIFSGYYEIQSSVDKVKFSRRSLASITCQYNALAGEGRECITYAQGSRLKLRIGPSFGFSSATLKTLGEEPFDSFHFTRSNDAVVGLELDLTATRLGSNLSFQIGSGWSKNHFHAYIEKVSWSQIETNTYDVTVEGILMNLYGGARYRFTRGKIRPYLGGGLYFDKYLQPDFNYVRVYQRLTVESTYEWHPGFVSNWFYGAYLQAGVEFPLTRKMVLFAGAKGGYCTTNPKTIAGLNGGIADQIRIRTVLIPVTIRMGLLF